MMNGRELREISLTLYRFKRTVKHCYQKLTRGFSDRDLWNADVHFAKLIAPRLKEFKKKSLNHPSALSNSAWYAILDDMIFAFELKVKEGVCTHRAKVDDIRYLRGLHLFAKYFDYLWN